jgi:SpoVK/Ycf46/Vps4 family AAA+-type ATPase
MSFLLESSPLRDISGEFVYEFLNGQVPSVYSFGEINMSKAFEWCSKNFELFAQVIADHDTSENNSFHRALMGKSDELDFSSDESNTLFFFCKGSLLIRLNNYGKNAYLSVYSSNMEELKKAKKECECFVERKKKNSEIGVLIAVQGHVQIKKIPLEVAELDVALNYGSDFAKQKHDSIVQKLKEERSGLYLFYGEAGTGKTNYVKYLSKLVHRDFIFVPTNMIDSLVSPDLIQTLINHENLVLILEDAEKAVVNREENHNEALVSTILNLTDGIIGNLFNVSILVTFNTAKERIDKALYRKGRLKVEHDFKPLDIKDSQALLDKLGKNAKATKPMTLAQIYNVDEDNFHREPERRAAYGQSVI